MHYTLHEELCGVWCIFCSISVLVLTIQNFGFETKNR